MSHIKHPSPHEEYLNSIVFDNPIHGSNHVGNRIEWLRSCSALHQKIFGDLDTLSDEYIQNIFPDIKIARDAHGLLFQEDYSSRWVNVVAGNRLTTGHSTQCDRTIHAFGASEIFGMGCEDSHTIPSFLQKRFNDAHATGVQPLIWRVQNYGVRAARLNCNLIRIWQADISPGDIVVLFDNYIILPQKDKTGKYTLANERVTDIEEYNNLGIPCIDARYMFERPHNYGEIFFDSGHFSYKGNTIIADVLFNYITAQIDNVESRTTPATAHYHTQKATPAGISHPKMQEYIDFLHKNSFAPTAFGFLIGATVITANPLTLGHVHLLETAAGMVDHLYIFVVQENRFFFSFADRFKLVKAGIAHVDNVSVFHSGEFMVSSESFPEYFNKATSQHVSIDATRDILPFCIHIAPLLRVNRRFVGEEPLCQITKQHNEQLKIICPKHGIKLIEIPRIKRHEHIVSASLVRRLYTNKDWDQIHELVPQVTFNYLRQRENTL